MTSIIDDDNNNNVNKNSNDNNNSAAINTTTRIESNIVSIIDQSSSFTPNLYVKQSQLGEVVGDGDRPNRRGGANTPPSVLSMFGLGMK